MDNATTKQTVISTKEFVNGNYETVYMEGEQYICKLTKMPIVAKITIEPMNDYLIDAELMIKCLIHKHTMHLGYDRLPDGTFAIYDLDQA